MALDSKLRGCDLVSLKVSDVAYGSSVSSRATVLQQKTGSPVQFEITKATREAADALINAWQIASPSSMISALRLNFANCLRAPDRISSTCSPFPLVTLYQSKYLKCATKVMINAADMLLTCVMNAGLITKLRELCPLPCGLFCCSAAPEIGFTALVTFRVTPGID